jgi:hypothetical protein
LAVIQSQNNFQNLIIGLELYFICKLCVNLIIPEILSGLSNFVITKLPPENFLLAGTKRAYYEYAKVSALLGKGDIKVIISIPLMTASGHFHAHELYTFPNYYLQIGRLVLIERDSLIFLQ